MALLILAGGQSSRMGGRDKALLELGERTMVERTIEQIGELFPEIILVAKDEEPYRKLPVRVIYDQYPGCGPISGIHAGLFASSDPYNLVVGCDQPLINRELVQYLWERARAQQRLLTIPEIGGRLEPLLGVYHQKLIERFEDAIRAHHYSLQKVLRSVRLDLVNETEVRKFDPQLRSFMNVNTPEDAQMVRQLLKRVGQE